MAQRRRRACGIRSGARQLGQAVLPTQLITKPLQIEVLIARRPARQAGRRPRRRHAARRLPVYLPHPRSGRPHRRADLRGESRRQADGDRGPRSGAADRLAGRGRVRHRREAHHRGARARSFQPAASRGRTTNAARRRPSSAAAAAPADPRRHRRGAEADRRVAAAVQRQLSHAACAPGRSNPARILLEALRYDDEPKAIQRMAELRELLQQLETSRGQMLDPPWPRFAQLVQHCLDLAARGRRPDRPRAPRNCSSTSTPRSATPSRPTRSTTRRCTASAATTWRSTPATCRSCCATRCRVPPRPSRPPEEEARAEIDRFRAYLSSVWKQVREKQRADLEARLTEIAGPGARPEPAASRASRCPCCARRIAWGRRSRRWRICCKTSDAKRRAMMRGCWKGRCKKLLAERRRRATGLVLLLTPIPIRRCMWRVQLASTLPNWEAERSEGSDSTRSPKRLGYYHSSYRIVVRRGLKSPFR